MPGKIIVNDMLNIDKKCSFFIIITALNKIKKFTALKVANNYEHTIFDIPAEISRLSLVV